MRDEYLNNLPKFKFMFEWLRKPIENPGKKFSHSSLGFNICKEVMKLNNDSKDNLIIHKEYYALFSLGFGDLIIGFKTNLKMEEAK